MTDEFDYKTDSQQAIEAVWKLVDDFQEGSDQSAVAATGLSTRISQLLSGVENIHEREKAYAGITEILAIDLSNELLLGFLSEIKTDRLASVSALKAANEVFDREDEDGGARLLAYGEKRINSIDDPSEQFQTWIEYADSASENGREIDGYLANAKTLTESRSQEKWGIERQLEIANVYKAAERQEDVLPILDLLQDKILNLSDDHDRNLLLNRLCILYIQSGEFSKPVALASQFTPESISLKARSLAQETMKQKEYIGSTAFIALIIDPYQKFLAWESLFSNGKRSRDTGMMKRAADEVKQLAPSIPSGKNRFEAYLMLAKYYVEIEDRENAEEFLGLAGGEADTISSNLQAMLKKRIRSLQRVIDLW